MVEVTSKTGITKDLSLDFDSIVGYEEAHPEYSFLEDVGKMADNMKLSTLDRLTKLVYDGQGWKQFVKDGFTMNDLSTAILESLKELGFTQEENAGEA